MPVEILVDIWDVTEVSLDQVLARIDRDRDLLPVGSEQDPSFHVHDLQEPRSEIKDEMETTTLSPPEPNLSASLVGAATAIGGAKTEAAGAAFRVGGV